jgi:hypothetical protein
MRAGDVSHCDKPKPNASCFLLRTIRTKKVFCEGKDFPVQETFLFWEYCFAYWVKKRIDVLIFCRTISLTADNVLTTKLRRGGKLFHVSIVIY